MAIAGLVIGRLDRAARALLQGGPTVDFAKPRGEPALVPADSVSWRIFKNPLALLIGGIAAVILELAEPRVRAGVWDHSSFRSDPRRRLQRTGLAAMVTVYGAHSTAEAMIAGVVRRHDTIQGTTAEGAPYHANEQALLDWVQATASFGFAEAYHLFVRPLSGEERDRLCREALPAAALYGARGMPETAAGVARMFAQWQPVLEPSPVIGEFLAIMRRTPVLPGPLSMLQGLIVRAAVSTVPEQLRRHLELDGQGLRPGEAALLRLAGRLAERLPLPSSPPVQACLRLGLPDDYLFR